MSIETLFHVQKVLTNVWVLCQLLVAPVHTRDFVPFGKFLSMLQVSGCHSHNLRVTKIAALFRNRSSTVML